MLHNEVLMCNLPYKIGYDELCMMYCGHAEKIDLDLCFRVEKHGNNLI